MDTFSIPVTPILPFISNDKLFEQVKIVLRKAQKKLENSKQQMHKNVIDPFSAIFEALINDISFEEWIERERMRQTQKTFQNSIGEFHQGILGSVEGWENLGTGHVVDLKNDQLKTIAEIKNKFNTTKGNDKMGIYDNFMSLLDGDLVGYTGYYVEIIPQGRKQYDNAFTPPDNTTKTKRPSRNDIRIIDGKSFYSKVTGYPNALENLYRVLPTIITQILGTTEKPNGYYASFQDLFNKAF